ncbi:hypothetical protein ACFS07_23420 [Undibacterium arcticum]
MLQQVDDGSEAGLRDLFRADHDVIGQYVLGRDWCATGGDEDPCDLILSGGGGLCGSSNGKCGGDGKRDCQRLERLYGVPGNN